MSFQQKLRHEIKAVAIATAFFAGWFGILILLKRLILTEYEIDFRGLSTALIGALVVAKVVLVLEHVPLGGWMRRQPAWVDLVARTLLYAAGVFAAMLIEKAFHGRHEYGGFGQSLAKVFQHADIHHVWAAAIGVTGGLLVYNIASLLRRSVGDDAMRKAFLAPREPATHPPSHA